MRLGIAPGQMALGGGSAPATADPVAQSDGNSQSAGSGSGAQGSSTAHMNGTASAASGVRLVKHCYFLLFFMKLLGKHLNREAPEREPQKGANKAAN